MRVWSVDFEGASDQRGVSRPSQEAEKLARDLALETVARSRFPCRAKAALAWRVTPSGQDLRDWACAKGVQERERKGARIRLSRSALFADFLSSEKAGEGRDCVAPPGLAVFVLVNPALARWANLCRPSGAWAEGMRQDLVGPTRGGQTAEIKG